MAGLVTGSELQLFESGEPPFELHRPQMGAENVYPGILIENTVGNPSLTMIKRECFSQVGGFDETLRLGQDWDMWIRIARVFPVGCVDRPLIRFVRHATSLTAGQVWSRYSSNRAIQRRYISRLPNARERRRLLFAAQSMNLYYTAAALSDMGQSRRASMGLAVAATLLDPTYESRHKAGLILRTMLGRNGFRQLSRLLGRG